MPFTTIRHGRNVTKSARADAKTPSVGSIVIRLRSIPGDACAPPAKNNISLRLIKCCILFEHKNIFDASDNVCEEKTFFICKLNAGR